MILDKIAARTLNRLAMYKEQVPLSKITEQARELPSTADFPFEQALKKNGLSFICEVKRASPSNGIISQDFNHLAIAHEYTKAGADAISVLTEPEFFQGSDRYLREISAIQNHPPLLRKDFILDPYQIYQAKTLGASAVLLICALLDRQQLCEYLDIAHSLGLSALVETHTEEEVNQAVAAGARIIGVNNRNLHTFEVDLKTSLRLRPLIPEGTLFVSESGIRNADDLNLLRENGTDAVLIGEALMRQPDKAAFLEKMRNQ